MNLDEQLNERSLKRPGRNDQVLQAGTGFVAYATFRAEGFVVNDRGCLVSRSASTRELKEQILCRERVIAGLFAVQQENLRNRNFFSAPLRPAGCACRA